jgi:predicted phosphodiesterase
MLAIISDIHSNIEALHAVVEDIRAKDIDNIVCLGDVIGYGPNPKECIDLVRAVCRFTLKGNHDEAVMEGAADEFRPQARSAAMWTRKLLDVDQDSSPEAEERWKWMATLPEIVQEGPVTYVHGSPRLPTKEYVFPRDAQNFGKMQALFQDPECRILFGGHSHIPGVWTLSGEYYSPDDLCNIYMTSDVKVYVNVGSVGQPRDNNPNSSYVTFDGDTIVFRRVPYDHKSTADKILAIEELDDFFAKRLYIGR